MTRLSRISYRLFFTACLAFFCCAVALPLLQRTVQVDIDGWPIGLEHPACPKCRTTGSTIIDSGFPGSHFRCHHCHHEFWATPPPE
ncbi:MAG: hypothetical protein IT428_05115 [Planctomycetaceae bacterium]|nr:hypothetical protein [Planctomycetaceae bacterium]